MLMRSSVSNIYKDRRMGSYYWKSKRPLTDGGDNGPSKEKGGADVPEACLIERISWRIHTCSDCWNHLLEQKGNKKGNKKIVSA